MLSKECGTEAEGLGGLLKADRIVRKPPMRLELLVVTGGFFWGGGMKPLQDRSK